MISESGYWKHDLCKWAKQLRRRMQQKRWSERSCARVEQTIMIGFYAIRKLCESKKLTDAIVHQRVPVTAFPHSGKNVTFMNNHHVDRLYHLERGTEACLTVIRLCNQVIHSNIFVPCFDETTGGLSGALFVSDRDRNRRLILLELTRMISLFESVADDDVVRCQMRFDSNCGDYVVQNFAADESNEGAHGG